MVERSRDPTDVMPCPDCGSDHLIVHETQSADMYVDDDGNINYFEPRGPSEIQEVWCPKCDEKLWERSSEE